MNDVLEALRQIEIEIRTCNSIAPYARQNRKTKSKLDTYEKWLQSVDQKGHIKTPFKFCYDDLKYHSSLKKIDELRPIGLKEMMVNQIHYDCYLEGTVVHKPFYHYGIELLIVDNDGEFENVSLFNYNLNYSINPELIIPKGSKIIIKEPNLKVRPDLIKPREPDCTKPRSFHIQVDSPSDIIICEGLNVELFKEELAEEEIIRLGNSCFVNKEYMKAVEFYRKALSINESNVDVWSNLAAAYLKLEKFYSAYECALKAPNEKGYYRLGIASYSMRQYEKAIEAFENCLKVNASNKIAKLELDKSKLRLHESKTGEYNFKKVIDDYNYHGKVRHDIADYTNESVKVTDIVGKGKGLVATREIKRGTLLIGAKSYSTAFECELNYNPDRVVRIDPFKKKKDELCVDLNQVKFFQKVANDPFNAEKIYKLYHGKNSSINRNQSIKDGIVDATRLAGILKNNNLFKVSSNVQEEIDKMLDDKINPTTALEFRSKKNCCIWIMPSYINHSCLCNCLRLMYGDICFVFAFRDIKEGEELTFYYTQGDNYDIRALQLKDYDISCDCKLCLSEKNDSKRWNKFIQYQQELIKMKSIPKLVKNLPKVKASFDRIAEIYKDREFKNNLIEPMNKLVEFYFALGKFDIGSEMVFKVFEIAMSVNDMDHLKAANVAVTAYLTLNKYDKAEDIMRRVLHLLPFNRTVVADNLKKYGFNIEPFLHLFN
jgi:tetratricopeptide (TPR) repeat protein